MEIYAVVPRPVSEVNSARDGLIPPSQRGPAAPACTVGAARLCALVRVGAMRQAKQGAIL